MDSPKLFYKINSERLVTNSNLKGVYFTKPRLVALYDLNHHTVEPAKKIFYFKEPEKQKYPIDLNVGYETYVRRKDLTSTYALQCTLKYVMSPKAQINVDSIDKIKFFTKRGTLVNLMICNQNCTKCVIRASRYDGNFYMVHIDSDEDYFNSFEPKHTHHEQLLKNLFTESLKDEPKVNEITDENKRLIGVHKSNLGKFEIVYHGEIQGIQTNEEITKFDDLEALNSCNFVMAKQMWYYLRNNHSKMLTYWLQAYLANVLDLYFAYKDKDGIVHQPILHKKTSELPKEFNWKPGILTEFLYEFLQRVYDLMTNDNINSLNTVYEIYYNPKIKTFTYKIFKEDTDKIFITREYMEYCKQL